MNIDTQFSPASFTAPHARPLQRNADPVSSRPVERPPNDEAANNQPRQDNAQTRVRADNEQARGEERSGIRRESELNADEKRQVQELQARDREVRAHEAAHKNAAGNLARGGAQFEFETGPDGRRYAVGGEVSIDVAKVAGDPQATIDKAQTIRRAATAPVEPSSQDRAVAAEATRIEAEARAELREASQADATPGAAAGAAPADTADSERSQDAHAGHAHADSPPLRRDFSNSDATQPAAVGELLDVIA